MGIHLIWATVVLTIMVGGYRLLTRAMSNGREGSLEKQFAKQMCAILLPGNSSSIYYNYYEDMILRAVTLTTKEAEKAARSRRKL